LPDLRHSRYCSSAPEACNRRRDKVAGPGAPRPMKMGTMPWLWRYDVGAYDTPLLAENAKSYDYALRSVTAVRARTSSHDVPNLRPPAVRGMADVPQ
jgi:hypothetical protein